MILYCNVDMLGTRLGISCKASFLAEGTRPLQVKKVELLHYCQMGHKSRLPSRSLLTLRWGRDNDHCRSEGGEEGEFHTGWEEQECLTIASHGASTDHMESIG